MGIKSPLYTLSITYITYIVFSIQVTYFFLYIQIGYGARQTTNKCPEAIFMQSLQSVVGVIIQACMVGIIFSKMSRPKKRVETL